MNREKLRRILQSKYWEMLYFLVFSIRLAKIIIKSISFINPPAWILTGAEIESFVFRAGILLLLLRKAFLFAEESRTYFKTRENGKALLQNTCENVFFCIGILFEFFSISRICAVLLLLAWLCGEYSYTRLTKIFLSVQAACILLWLGSYAAGNATDEISIFDYATCHSFGTINPNTSGLLLTFFFFTMVYLFGEKHRIMLSAAAAVLIAVDWFAFGCRTQMVILFAVTVLLWLLPLYDKLGASVKKPINALFFISPLLLFFFTFALGMIIERYHISGDSNFLCRFHEAITGYREIGLHLWKPDWSSVTSVFYLDNLYAGTLYENGILALCWNMALMLMVNYRAIKEKNAPIAIIAVGFYLMFLMENCRAIGLLLIMGCYYCSKEGKTDAK